MEKPSDKGNELIYDALKIAPEKVINPLKLEVTATYDYRLGLQTSYTDENQFTWKHVYDGFGRIIKEIEPGDTEDLPTREYLYQDFNAINFDRPISIIKKERKTQGKVSVFSTYQYYDGFLRDIQTRKPWAVRRGFSFLRKFLFPRWIREWLFLKTTYYHVISRVYNCRGEIMYETLPYLDPGSDYRPPNPINVKYRFAYDALLRHIKIVQPDDNILEFHHKPWENTIFDEEDCVIGSPHHNTPSTFHFNADESIRQVDRRKVDIPMGIRTLSYQFEYDLFGNVIKATDPASNEIHWTFDTRGNLIQLIHPDGGTIYNYYDAAGREVARDFGNGSLIESKYDKLDRIKTKQFSGTSPRTETYTYDAGEGTNLVGRLAEVEDAVGTIAFGYDSRGQQVWQKRIFISDPGEEYVTKTIYDPMGRLRSIVYPDLSSIQYHYGINSKIERVTDLFRRITYHSNGKPSMFEFIGGARQVILYNPKTNRVDRRQVTVRGQIYHDLSYTYDQVGNVVTVTDRCNVPTHTVMNRNYDYDSLYRLKRFTSSQGHMESYDYDDIGNITLHTGYSANQLEYPPVGQTSTMLGAQGETPWQYDVSGKLTRGAGFDELHWDAAQNLIKAKQSDGTQHDYRYSYEGELLERIKTPVGGVSETFRIVNKHYSVFPDRTLRRTYVYEKLSVIMSKAGGNSTPIFTINDELGNIIGVVDENNSFIQVEYAPYGNRLHQSSPRVQHGFGSNEEVALNLIAFRFRFLLTSVGRWIQPDPLILQSNKEVPSRPELLNLYAYAHNNPISLVDMLGLLPGDPYRTADMAAVAALNEIMATSRGLNREFGGVIYMNMDGTFSYTMPIQGSKAGLKGNIPPVQGTDWNWSPPGKNVAGTYHTHGRYDKHYKKQWMSGTKMDPTKIDTSKRGDTDLLIQGVPVPVYTGLPGRKIGEQGNKIVKYTPRHAGAKPKPSDFEVLQGPQSLPKEDVPQ